MKRVFVLFSLMIGLFFISQAEPSFYGCDTPAMITPGANDDGPCEECIVKPAGTILRYFNTGGCEFSFILFSPPSIFPDSYCNLLGLTIKYSWDFGDLTPPTPPAAGVWMLHSFPANGTYTVCITPIVYDASNNVVCTLTPTCETVNVTKCDPPCDPLDCSKIQVQSVSANQVSFLLPVQACDDCQDPEYTVSYRRSEVGESYTSAGVAPDNGEVVLSLLQPCTNYEILIELRCDGSDEVIKSCTFNVMTIGCMTDCNPGFDCNQIMMTVYHSVARFSFPRPNCPNCPNPRFDAAWRAVTTPPSAWNNTSIGYSSLSGNMNGNITGLQPCTNYELRIEFRCPNPLVPDPWNEPVVATCIIPFTTLCPFIAPEGDGLVEAAPLQLSVYPNPAKELVNFIITCDQDTEGVIRIYNNTGVLVKQVVSRTNDIREVDLHDMPAGIYYYSFTSDLQVDLRSSGKFVVNK